MILRSRDPMSAFRKGNEAVTHIAIEPPFRSADWIEHQRAFALRASTDALGNHGVWACRVWAEETWHAGPLAWLDCTGSFTRTV